MHSADFGTHVFLYNSDLSGDVKIIKKLTEDEMKNMSTAEIIAAQCEIEVPGHILLDFVADYVRNERIAKLEQMSTDEILGV